MKKVIFTKIALICAMFFCSSFVAFADTQFQMPSPPKASALVSSETDTVYMYNVGVAQFLNAGNMWGTQAVVAKKGLPIKAIQDENGEWSFYFYEGSQYEQLLFRSDEEGVYVDFDWNGESQWSLTSVGNNTYRIQSSMYGDWGFGEYDVENNWFLGQDPDREDYYTDDHEETWGVSVWGDVTPTASTNVDWQFIKKSDYVYYEAKITLLELMKKAEMIDIEFDDALAVYNNETASLAELNQAIENLGSQLGDYEFLPIVSESDVPIFFKNDENHPWTVEGNTAIIRGNNQSNYYSASWLTMSFSLEKETMMTFDWACYNYDYHPGLELYVDGVYNSKTTNSSYTLKRLLLEPGDHVIAFRDSVSYRNYTQNWSGIKNIQIKTIVPPDYSPVLAYSDVDNVTFTNSNWLCPWDIEDNVAIVRGKTDCPYSTSWLTMSYQSDKRTVMSFDWAMYNYNYHESLQVYIDGIYQGYTTNSSYTSQRFYLDAGEHVIAFRDSVRNYNYTENWSAIKNVRIKEILPLETAVLTENSMPLTFTNNSATPWIIEDGYIEHQNLGVRNSASSFSTTFTIDKTSKLQFTYKVANYNYSDSYNYEDSHNLFVTINGIQISKSWDNINDTYWCVALEPGDYTVVWKDTVYNRYSYNYYTQIKNIELSNNWITCELATAGTLGVEALYQVDVLNDVEMLKVVGPMNSSDWTDIKNMTNLKALDLSEAVLTEIPNYALDGKGWINSVILPEGIKSIGQYAFRGTSIRRISIPSTVTTIRRNAFISTPLQSLTFAEGSQLRTIEKYAFQSCSSLQEVVLPNGVESIGYCSFDLCSSIKKVEMPNTVNWLGAYAFASCPNMKSIRFSDALTELPEWVCGWAYSLTDVHLPSRLTRVNYESFVDNTSLRHIDIPSTVNTIVRRAFYNCGVDSVLLPTRLQYLGTEAFSHCNNLKYIEFPSYIERGNYSYIYNYWSEGTDPGWTDESSGYRSNFTYCPNIETIVMRSAAPPVNDADAFANSRTKSAITLKVPSFAVVNYKLDTYWYQFGSIVEGDDVDYWRIANSLSLTNNRRMQGKPDIDLYYGGQFTVGGNAPMEIGRFNYYVSESNPGRLLNTCEAMTADDINIYFSVSSEKWYFFTPIYDVDLTKVTVSNGASYVFRYYDGDSRATNGTGNSWRNVDNGKLIAGQGYIFRCNADAVLTMPTGSFSSIAPMANEEAWEAKVSYAAQSGSDWTKSTFDDSSWLTQRAAWGTTESYPNVENNWSVENSDIYVRRTINLTADDIVKNLWIQYSNDDYFELYINGTPVINTGYTGVLFEKHRLSDAEKQLLHVGENIIAAYCHNYGGAGYIDFGLYEKIFADSENYTQVFNTADVTKQLTAYEAAASANKSWNYVGNPYPCYYDIYYMDFTAPITVWTGSTYKAYSIVDDNYALRPMQSFFVQKPDAVDNIVFHKEGRQLTSDINHAAGVKEFAPANQNRHFFDLQMLGDEAMDETRVVLNDEASLDYEIERDASKFMSFESAVPQMFTLDAQGNGYAINERPIDDGKVKLAYYAGQAGFYTISANRADGEIYLYDAKTNKTVNLMEQDYTFYSDVTESPNTTRFVLSLNPGDETGINVVEKKQEDGFIYDLQGRQVQNASKGIFIQNGQKVVRN